MVKRHTFLLTNSDLMKVLSYILLASYLFGIFTPVLPYFEFQARWDYIAKNLCVNKDNPVSTCAGKCYLNKRLKEASGEEKDTSDSPRELRVKENPPQHITDMLAGSDLFLSDKTNWFSEVHLHTDHIPNIDIPPPRIA